MKKLFIAGAVSALFTPHVLAGPVFVDHDLDGDATDLLEVSQLNQLHPRLNHDQQIQDLPIHAE